MTSHFERTGRLDDAGVEALLVEFFTTEMPAELRATTDPTGTTATPLASSPAASPPVAPLDRPLVVRAGGPGNGRSRGFAGLIAAAASLAVLVVAAQVAGPSRPSLATQDGIDVARVTDPVERSAVPPVEEPTLQPAFTLTEEDLFVERIEGRVEALDSERFDTARGPVELRAVRETTHVSVVDPATGQGVDLETQVLDIEVVPIELDTPPGFDDPTFDPDPADELPRPRGDDPRLPEAGAPR